MLTLILLVPASTRSCCPTVYGRFANRQAGLPNIHSSAFLTESDEIERKANGACFLWTIADSNAYASSPTCLSDVGSKNANQFCASRRRESCVGWQSRFVPLCLGMWPVFSA